MNLISKVSLTGISSPHLNKFFTLKYKEINLRHLFTFLVDNRLQEKETLICIRVSLFQG